jgi:serine protease
MKKHHIASLVVLTFALVACPATPEPEPIGTELLTNGGFENGTSGWGVFTENNGVAEQGRQKYCAKTGDAYGALGGVGKSSTFFARAYFDRRVDIPATGTTTLRYSVRIDTLEAAGSDKDTFTASVDDSLVGTTIKTNRPRDVHTTYSVDLSDSKGKNIRLKFEAFNNESANTVFCLDDVSVKHIP